MKKTNLNFWRRFLFVGTLMVTISCELFSQMIHFTMPPKRVNTTTSSPFISTIPNAPSNNPYSVANGAYDLSGNLLFYIIDYTIYAANGTAIGTLSPGAALAPPCNGGPFQFPK